MGKGNYISHEKHVPFEYSKITNQIYLGTNQCCQMHFEASLLKKGITADVSLEGEHLDRPYGVDYFLWLPVEDHFAPTQEQFLIGAKAIKSFIDAGVKIYIHCKRGHGRSPIMLAAFFVLEGMNSVEAVKKIRVKRGIHLRREQIAALREFEKSLR